MSIWAIFSFGPEPEALQKKIAEIFHGKWSFNENSLEDQFLTETKTETKPQKLLCNSLIFLQTL